VTDKTPITRARIAIIPVRSLERAKSRLGAVLDPEERRDLVLRLLARTIRAVLEAPSLGVAVVVSPDPAVLETAASAGARPLAQRGSGLNGSLDEARTAALAAGARCLLILPADLPTIEPSDLEALVAAAESLPPGPRVVLVPDRHGRGTNALLLEPPTVIPFAFGGDSRAAHSALAAAAGAAYAELDGRLSLDLDTPDDLLALEAADPTAVLG
jgi:2-phospho-L-lactate guanylyltransferase